MPALTPARTVLQPSTGHGGAAAGSSVVGIIGGGRTAVGDRRPAAKPATPPVSPAPAPVEKPARMGCSGYRIKHGTSDQAIIQAIREHAARSVAETDGSPWGTASSLTDEQLLSVIGWSISAKTACDMVARHLAGLSR